MADPIAQIEEESTTTSTVEEDFSTSATVNSTVTSATSSISDSTDIDTATNGLQTGSMLVYNTTTGKWVSTITLESQDITGGQY